MIGPGKAFDTDRYFIICSNVLGGCQGTTGPASINPATGKPYAMSFPVITIADMVRLQRLLLDSLGIPQFARVCGGSMGGMQALEWAVSFPEFVRCRDSHRDHRRVTAHNRSRSTKSDARRSWPTPTGTAAITTTRSRRAAALGIARMVGHITYMSDESMREKFGRRLREKEKFGFDFSVDFEVESYLRYRGSQFVTRFDANSYLYITKAEDYFDLTNGTGSLARGFRHRDHAISGDQLHVGLAVSQLPVAGNRARAAAPQRRRRLLRSAIELRPRCVLSGRRGADRHRARIPAARTEAPDLRDDRDASGAGTAGTQRLRHHRRHHRARQPRARPRLRRRRTARVAG